MNRYHKCPMCGYPAKVTFQGEFFSNTMVGKLRQYRCEHCNFVFWREPGR